MVLEHVRWLIPEAYRAEWEIIHLKIRNNINELYVNNNNIRKSSYNFRNFKNDNQKLKAYEGLECLKNAFIFICQNLFIFDVL
jgi:Leucine-rich repeat (LRR) protein